MTTLGMVLVSLVGVLASGCAGPGEPGAGGTTSTSHRTIPSSRGTSTTAPSGKGEVVIDEHANNTTVPLSVGQRLVLRLHSTYWHDVTSTNAATLRVTGRVVTPQMPDSRCPPGAGCGTVEVTLEADEPGTATVSARRQLCGEAVACPAADRSFAVRVEVTR